MTRSPKADETAAIAAAIERFRAETAPSVAAAGRAIGPWQQAALVEGVGAKVMVETHKEE
jgi:hypothetical protein